MTKKCSKCKRIKPVSEFTRDKNNKDGLDKRCKACKKENSHARYADPVRRAILLKNQRDRLADDTALRARVRAQREEYHLKHTYGLTLEAHKRMYFGQNGCCAVCGKPTEYDRVVVDHDHGTGKVRGLLCYRCNRDLSVFDDPDRFERAISYLERNR